MKKLIPFLTLLILISACRKTQTRHYTPLNMSDYPVNIGNIWTYQVWDSVTNVTDTVVFKITAKTVVNADTSIYNYQTSANSAVVDSGTITQSLTAYSYSSYTGNGIFQWLRLTFPINITGAQVLFPQDTIYGIAVLNSFAVLGNTYTNVYQLQRSLSVPDLYIQANIYEVPGIGIIQETLDISPWIPQHKVIRLISYYVH